MGMTHQADAMGVEDDKVLPAESESPLAGWKSASPRGGPADLEPDRNGTDMYSRLNKTVTIRNLLEFADSVDIALMIVGAVGSIAVGTAVPLQALLLGQLVDAFGASRGDVNTMKREVAKVALRYVYVGCGAAVATFCGTAGWMITAERQAARIRGLYLKAILRQDVSFFDQEISSGEVISRISKDVISIQEAINGKVLELISTFVSGIIISFTRSWKLTLLLTATMPLYGLVGWQMGMRISQLELGLEMAYSEAGRVVEQALSAIRTVASYTGEKKAVDKYDRVLEDTEKIGIQANSVLGFGMALILSTLLSSYALALWYASRLAASGEIPPGHVITALFAVVIGGTGLAQMPPNITALAVGRVAAFNMFQVIHRKPVIDSTNMSGLIHEMIGNIELRKVYFAYPTRPDIPVFRNFSLTIEAGSTAALVGESGSGKSTAISLIERFYDPQAGAVLIDGIDVRTMQLRWLRQQIALVSQEPVLFGTTIRDNIAYGKDGVASLEEIRGAAQLANAALFIDRMPQGYDTQVGERGIQLSGGQKQRVAIARAVLKNARILLLDEATSALDSESERMVQVALDRVMVDRTTVVVAHRLSTIKNADLIAVVKEGVILETGTHSELNHRPQSAYNQLIRLQDMNLQKRQAEESEKAAAESFRSGNLNSHSFSEGAEGGLSKHSGRHGGSSRRLGHPSRSRRISSTRFSFISDNASRTSSMPRRDDALLDSIDLEEGRELEFQQMSEVHEKFDEEIDEVQTTGLQRASIFHLAALNKPEMSFFALGALASAVSGVILPCFGLFLAHVIGDFFGATPHDIRKRVGFWALMFLVLAVVQLISSPTDAICFGIAGSKLIRRVRTQTFDKIIRQEIAWFDDEKNSSGALSARLYTDAAGVRGLVGDALTVLVKSFTTVVVGLVFAFTNGWQLAFVVLGLIPVLSAQGIVTLKGGEGFAASAKEKYEKASQIAYSAVSNIRTVASFCLEERIVKLFTETCKEPIRSGIKLSVNSGIGQGLASFTLFGGYAFGFWIGSRFVVLGLMSFEDVFKVFLSIALTAVGVAQGFALAPNLSKAKASVNSIFAILNQESKIDPANEEGRTLPALKGHIEFKDVVFSYPTRPQACVLRNLSFTLKGGKTLALVGESGSGKTSVISLLQRFYDANFGSILVDGVEIRALQLKWLRRQMGLVGQEPFLFDDSIKANIVYGKDDFTKDEDVRGAAKVANAHNFILTLPEGYDTQVGERGVQLSGGQKQRVAIARAVVKNPTILLLDEATSALDAESEHVVQQALDQIMVGRSTIVVAHRLSAVKHCDQIAVIKNGAIVEKGTYDELLKNKDGAFSALHQVHNDSMTS